MIAKQPIYQVKYGYGFDDYIQVYASELMKLHLCIHRNAMFIGELGDVDTSKIMAVRPDYKATYGCEPNYRLGIEDLDEIARVHGNIAGYVGLADVTAKQYLKEGREQEILDGKVKLKQLAKPKNRTNSVSSVGVIIKKKSE